MSLQSKNTLDEIEGSVQKGLTSVNHTSCLLDSHRKMSASVLTQDVKAVQNALGQLEMLVSKLSSSLPASPTGVEAFLSTSNINYLLSLTSTVPVLVSRLRRHYRSITTLSHDSMQTLETLKDLKAKTNQELLDYELQLNFIEKEIFNEQKTIETPKFNAVLPLLRHYDEKGPVEEAVVAFQQNPTASTCSTTLLSSQSESENTHSLSEKPHESNDVVMQAYEPQKIQEFFSSVSPNESLEDFYLNWLKNYLACRAKENAEIESLKQSRQTIEDKFKFFQKCEAELASKLNPLEKEMSKLVTVVTRTTASLTHTGCPRVVAPLVFPQKLYSLPPPLLTLYTKFFCYKAVSGDAGLELRLICQPTTKPSNGLFECETGRLQVVIDKSSTCMPPLTFTKTASVFPLSTRFSYFPKLNLVSAVCQFPRLLGSDVSFLSDLFFPNDDGSISPNPLHHLTTRLSQIDPLDEDQVCDHQQTAQESTCLFQSIATRIAELQAGRPYLWTQMLSDMTFNIDSSCVPRLNVSGEKASCVTAHNFVKQTRLRASYRTWNLYIEDSLRENPHTIPPRGVVIPPSLEAASVQAALMYQSFNVSTLEEFVNAGGSSEGKRQDTRFLNAQLKIQGIAFTVLIGVGTDGRLSEFCFYINDAHGSLVNSVLDSSASQSFTFLQKVLNASHEKIPKDGDKAIRLVDLALQCIHENELETLGKIMQKTKNVLEQNENTDGSFNSSMESLDENQLENFLRSLYPSSAHMISNPSAKTLTHFQEPTLTKLQDAVNISLPQTFLGEKSSYAHIMLVIQLVLLAYHLDRWVRDVVYLGHIKTSSTTASRQPTCES